MRPQDLTPAFAACAKAHRLTRGERAQIRRIEQASKAPNYYQTDAAAYDLHETLTDILDRIAPARHYFGRHPGDGADFGFWPHED